MSAWFVPKAHIDLLVTAAFDGPTDSAPKSWSFPISNVSNMTMDEAGRMLWGENVKSLEARYGGAENMVDPAWEAYHWTRTDGPIITILKAISCYEYQSCEHDGWERSKAWWFCHSLTAALIGCLPGFDQADAWPYEGKVVAKEGR